MTNVLRSEELALTDFVDVATLQSLQDGFAALTGVATSIRDPLGRPITKTSGEPQFCSVMKSSASGQAACRACHAEASQAVVHTGGLHRSKCHAGLTQLVAPIVVDGLHLGAIIVGDRPLRMPAGTFLEELADRHGISADEFTVAAHRLKPWRDRDMTAAAAFVQHLANTIAELCYQKHELARRVADLTTLYDVTSMLAGCTEAQEILDGSTRKLVETLGLRAAAVRLLDEETGELRIESVAHVSMSYVDTDPVPLSQSAIDAEVLETGRTLYIEDVREDRRTYRKERIIKEGLVSTLVTPLTSGGKHVGVLRIYKGCVYPFSAYEVSLLEAIASQIAAAIVNARLQQDAREAERLERQVRLAAEVQRRMIPAQPPPHPHYEFGCIHEPSSQLSGDFYDFLRMRDGGIGLVVADVVGKGVPASLTMASARSSLRAHFRWETDLAKLVRRVNVGLCNDTQPGEFVTAFHALLRGDGQRLQYSNAGHEPALLLRNGDIETLDVGGLVLGLDPDVDYETAETALRPGDVLAFFTDGLIDAMNFKHERYDRSRVYSSLRLHGSMAPDVPVELIAKQLLWDVRRFVGLAPQTDDMTIVVVKVR